jgi:uncharacterized protein (DUF4415 family)
MNRSGFNPCSMFVGPQIPAYSIHRTLSRRPILPVLSPLPRRGNSTIAQAGVPTDGWLAEPGSVGWRVNPERSRRGNPGTCAVKSLGAPEGCGETNPTAFAQADLIRHGEVVRRGKRSPQKAPTKKVVSLRLSPEVIDHFKSADPGWQTRIDGALRQAIRKRA